MKKIVPILIGLAGVGLVLHSNGRVRQNIEAHVLNPLELKGSPYGEIIGMALQEPVHLLWHGGQGHEHISGEGEECAVCGTEHQEDGVTSYLKEKPWTAQLKLKMLAKENKIRQNNNPLPPSDLVVGFAKQRARDLMELAYEMDPTNYGNYNVVSFQYSTGKDAEKRKRVEALAIRTLKACEGRVNDPEDALTAASAAENILLLHSRGVAADDYDSLEIYYLEFVRRVRAFDEVLQRAFDEKRLQSYSQEKVDEILLRRERFAYVLNGYFKKIQEAKGSVPPMLKRPSKD